MTKSIKKASENELSELLCLSGDLLSRMKDYKHVEDYCKDLHNQICKFQLELEKEAELRENI